MRGALLSALALSSLQEWPPFVGCGGETELFPILAMLELERASVSLGRPNLPSLPLGAC